MATVLEPVLEVEMKRSRPSLPLKPGGRYFADHPLTIEEFYELVDEDTRAELIHGVIVVPSPASDEHEDLFGWLICVCRTYVEERGLGIIRGAGTSVRLDEHNTRVPDLLFVSSARRQIVARLDVQGPPDWVVEIVNSDSARSDAIAKQAQYERLGVTEIWRIDLPRRKLTVVRRKKSGQYEVAFAGATGTVEVGPIPGLRLRLPWLWQAEKRPSPLRVVSRLLQRDA